MIYPLGEWLRNASVYCRLEQKPNYMDNYPHNHSGKPLKSFS